MLDARGERRAGGAEPVFVALRLAGAAYLVYLGLLLAHGLLFCSLGLAWLTAYSFAVARAGDLLRRPRIRRSLDALTGTVLVAFGIRLAADR